MDVKYVIKRDGRRQLLQINKLTTRLKKLTYGLSKEHCNPDLVAEKVVKGAFSGVRTNHLDIWAAAVAHQMADSHDDYDSLAGRIAVSNLHKNTNKSFSETMKIIHNEKGSEFIADDVYQIIIDNAELLDAEIVHERDFDLDYPMFKNIESILLEVKGEIVERPQHMWMMGAVETHKENIDAAIKAYHWVSCGPLANTPTYRAAALKKKKKKRDHTCMSWEKKDEGTTDLYVHVADENEPAKKLYTKS